MFVSRMTIARLTCLASATTIGVRSAAASGQTSGPQCATTIVRTVASGISRPTTARTYRRRSVMTDLLDLAQKERARRIANLNDTLRRTLAGRVLLTAGIDALPDQLKAQVLETVRTFSQ